jgi:hypothetical protein
VTDFVNLKIKPTQSFRCAHRDRVCVRVFIGINNHTCINIYVCTMFIKKIFSRTQDLVRRHFLFATGFLRRRRSYEVAAGNRTESGTAEASSQPPVRMGEDDMLTDSTSRFGRPWIAAGP